MRCGGIIGGRDLALRAAEIFHFAIQCAKKLWYTSFEPARKGRTMAKPVKETPVLYGEEARQFEVKMLHPKPLPPERAERILRDYEFLRRKCVNCSF